jgi:hypothetical protein
MAGFSSLDNLITNVSSSGKFWRADWNKNHATGGTVVAGTWQGLMGGAGNPPANTQLAGTTLIPQPCYDFGTTSGGIQHGGPVSAAYDGYKVILNASGFSAAATSCPCVLMLVDLLQIIPLANATISGTGTKTILGTAETVTFTNGTDLLNTTTDIPTYSAVSFTSTGTLPAEIVSGTVYWTIRQGATSSKLAATLQDAIAGTAINLTTDGTATITMQVRTPRYSDGIGVQALLVASTAGTAGTGTFQLTYTNGAGTGSKTTPSSPALPTNTATSPLLTIPYSGTGSGKYGPFFPLAAADTGIRSIQNIILASAGVTTGVYNLCLVKPLLTLPLSVIGVAAERDLVNQIPSMPRVYDGACLAWLIYSQVAIPNNTAYYGHLDFGWT